MKHFLKTLVARLRNIGANCQWCKAKADVEITHIWFREHEYSSMGIYNSKRKMIHKYIPLCKQCREDCAAG